MKPHNVPDDLYRRLKRVCWLMTFVRKQRTLIRVRRVMGCSP